MSFRTGGGLRPKKCGAGGLEVYGCGKIAGWVRAVSQTPAGADTKLTRAGL